MAPVYAKACFDIIFFLVLFELITKIQNFTPKK